jgi:hypothetical protein
LLSILKYPLVFAAHSIWTRRSSLDVAWTYARGLKESADNEPMHVAAYVKSIGGNFEKPTVKQHLAAIRMVLDWRVVG